MFSVADRRVVVVLGVLLAAASPVSGQEAGATAVLDSLRTAATALGKSLAQEALPGVERGARPRAFLELVNRTDDSLDVDAVQALLSKSLPSLAVEGPHGPAGEAAASHVLLVTVTSTTRPSAERKAPIRWLTVAIELVHGARGETDRVATSELVLLDGKPAADERERADVERELGRLLHFGPRELRALVQELTDILGTAEVADATTAKPARVTVSPPESTTRLGADGRRLGPFVRAAALASKRFVPIADPRALHALDPARDPSTPAPGTALTLRLQLRDKVGASGAVVAVALGTTAGEDASPLVEATAELSE